MSKELVLKMNNLPVPVDSLERYIQAVNSIPVLEPNEEKALLQRLRQQNDLDAARQLVMSHLRFVVHIARSYTGYGLPLGDLIQEGNVGLMKAVKRFDPDHEVRLVSFAVHWIRAEIHDFVLRNWRIVKVATTKAQRKLFFNLRSSKKRIGWLSAEETDAMARDLGVTAEVVREMEGRMSGQDVSFDPAAQNDGDDESGYVSPSTFLGDSTGDPAEMLEQQDWENRTQQGLLAAMTCLDDRSRDIVQRRWLGENKPTLHELAEEYGVSAERIRQLERNAMKKLQLAIA